MIWVAHNIVYLVYSTADMITDQYVLFYLNKTHKNMVCLQGSSCNVTTMSYVHKYHSSLAKKIEDRESYLTECKCWLRINNQNCHNASQKHVI